MNALQNIPIAVLLPVVNAVVGGIIGWVGQIESFWLILLVAVLAVGGIFEGVALGRALGFGAMATLGQLLAVKKQG